MPESPNAAEFDGRADDVFSRIASRYDRLCDVFSLFAHRYWKATLARRIACDAGGSLLDVASGTGDIALRVARLDRARRIVATDACPAMLAVARAKAERAGARLEFRLQDAHELAAVGDGSVDACSVSFGAKICDRGRLFKAAYRVLRPGGSFYCLEASRIPLAPLHRAYLRYMDWCLPIIARLATAGDRSAYDYLLRGIHEFPGAPALRAELEAAGFGAVSYSYLTFGIVALHVAIKPDTAPTS